MLPNVRGLRQILATAGGSSRHLMTAVEGTEVDQGDEFGYFQFGGSDIIVLLQAGVDAQFATSTTPRKVGSAAVRCS